MSGPIQSLPKDITPSSSFDHSSHAALRLFGGSHVAETWKELALNIVGIIPVVGYLVRGSYNPDTFLNRIINPPTGPVHEILKTLGLVVEKDAFVKNFTKVTAETDPTNLKLPMSLKNINRSMDVLHSVTGDNESLKDFNLKPLCNTKNTQDLFDQLPMNLRNAISQNNDGTIIDKNTGLHLRILVDKNDKKSDLETGKQKLYVVFAGTGNANIGDQDKNDLILDEQNKSNFTTVGLITSHVPPSYRQAAELVGVLKNIFGEEMDIEVSGYSKGGGEAAYSGIKNHLPVVTDCATPLSPACQRDLGRSAINDAINNNRIFNIADEGDLVSDSRLFKNLALVWESLTGLQVARRIGPGIMISNHGVKENQELFQHLSKIGIGGMSVHNKSMENFKNCVTPMLQKLEEKARVDEAKSLAEKLIQDKNEFASLVYFEKLVDLAKTLKKDNSEIAIRIGNELKQECENHIKSIGESLNKEPMLSLLDSRRDEYVHQLSLIKRSVENSGDKIFLKDKVSMENDVERIRSLIPMPFKWPDFNDPIDMFKPFNSFGSEGKINEPYIDALEEERMKLYTLRSNFHEAENNQENNVSQQEKEESSKLIKKYDEKINLMDEKIKKLKESEFSNSHLSKTGSKDYCIEIAKRKEDLSEADRSTLEQLKKNFKKYNQGQTLKIIYSNSEVEK